MTTADRPRWFCPRCGYARNTSTDIICVCGDPRPAVRRPCDHHESLWGRCTSCGMTWEEQQAERENR